MLSNNTYNKLYVTEGKSTTVKIFVGHNTPAAAFNSLEFSWKADEFDGEVCVCIIQASTVVMAVYLLGLSKTMDNIHWGVCYNNHPHLVRMDVQVKTHNIPDPSGAPWSSKNQIYATYFLLGQRRKTSAFKWVVCTTRKGKLLVQRLTFLKLGPFIMSLLRQWINSHRPPNAMLSYKKAG